MRELERPILYCCELETRSPGRTHMNELRSTRQV